MGSQATPIKVGFCGYGYSTRTFHLPFIIASANLTPYAFLQRNPKATVHGKPGSSAKDDFPDAKVYNKPEDFFADEEIELVVIATGHDSHATLAIAALEAGKHVVVEKCFTLGSEEADRIIAVHKKNPKLVLTVFQNRRYDSDYRTLAHLIQHPDKPLGRLAEVEFHYDVNGFWMDQKDPEHKPGSGLMFGIGCHVLDQALALFGRPATVTGFYECQHGDSKEDDNYTLILKYDSEEYKKLTVKVQTSSVNTMRVPLKYFARGTSGTFIKFGEDRQEPQVAEGLNPSSPGWGEEPEETYGTLTTVKQFHDGQKKETALSWVKQEVWEGKFPSLKGNYSDYYEDVVKAIRGGKTVITAQHARDGLRIIELGRESADLGKTLKMD